MHQNPIKEFDYLFQGMTNFTQGGVNYYIPDTMAGNFFKNWLNFHGWQGYGGSMMQYNIDHQIGYGYSMNMIHSEWRYNICAEVLKKMVYECA